MAEETPEQPETARITITRSSGQDNQQRQMIVTIDGKPFATLVYGRTVTREVRTGKRKLKIGNTWTSKTVELDIAPGEHYKFRIINTSGRFTWPMVALFGAGPMYVTVEPEA
ncbi:MAG: hypothetical protein LC126_12860 [Bryobacterales bacterium]|nr:hypothetical protein [Bryobacterales bacterium]